MPKLAIAPIIKVTVKAYINDNGKTVQHSVTLLCDRLEAEEQDRRIKQQGHTTLDFMTEVTKGWESQRLVVEDDGTPAPFTPENLALLFTVPNMANLAFAAFLAVSGAAKEKNS